MYILGISAFYYNSSCCLFKDGQLLMAAQEERFSRKKGDASLPVNAIRKILNNYNLTIKDIDLVCYYENPRLKFERQISMGLSMDQILKAKQKLHQVKDSITKNLGFDKEVYFSDHHLSHLGNGIFQSGWRDSSYITVDGVGEKNTLTWGRYDADGIVQLGSCQYPHSLGILYSCITSFLGFSVNEDEYKVMGLAAHGTPVYADILRKELFISFGKNLELNTDYFPLGDERLPEIFAEKLSSVLNLPSRKFRGDILPCHKDLAASLQSILEEELSSIIKEVFPEGGERLILSGGVAHNSLANQKLSELQVFKNVYIPAAPNDVGSSIGACVIYQLVEKQNLVTTREPIVPYWGPVRENKKYGYLDQFLKPIVISSLARDLAGGAVVAVCRGRMEFGDRALGNRSILAHPDYPGIKDLLNLKIKKREDYRPFAPVVLQEYAKDYFQIDEENLCMTKTYNVKKEFRDGLEGIKNIDGTARVQTLKEKDNSWLYQLIKEFQQQTGLPILINTSLNMNGEPIVLDETQALDVFLRTDIDILVLEDKLIYKRDVSPEWIKLYRLNVRGVANYQFKSSYDYL